MPAHLFDLDDRTTAKVPELGLATRSIVGVGVSLCRRSQAR